MNTSLPRRMLLLAAVLVTVGPVAVSSPADAVPIEGPANRACSDSLVELRLDRAPQVGDVITDGRLTVTITEVRTKDGGQEVIGFLGTSNIPVTAVYVKAANTVVRYSSFLPLDGGSLLASTRLRDFGAPLYSDTKANGTHYGISFVAFCY